MDKYEQPPLTGLEREARKGETVRTLRRYAQWLGFLNNIEMYTGDDSGDERGATTLLATVLNGLAESIRTAALQDGLLTSAEVAEIFTEEGMRGSAISEELENDLYDLPIFDELEAAESTLQKVLGLFEQSLESVVFTDQQEEDETR